MPEATATTPRASHDEQMRQHQEQIRDAMRYGFVLVGAYTENAKAARCCAPVKVDESEAGIIVCCPATLEHRGVNRAVSDLKDIAAYAAPANLQGEAA